MLTFTSFRFRSSAIRSSTGETAWHGPHHSAQKSTSTGSPLSRTSVSNVESVTSVAIRFLSSTSGDRYPISKVRTLLSTLRFPMAEEVFQPLPTVPDHPSLEEEVLA